jgi:hypothetical protein
MLGCDRLAGPANRAVIGDTRLTIPGERAVGSRAEDEFDAVAMAWQLDLSGTAEPLEYSNFRYRRWLPACEAAGVKGLQFHDLRRANATGLVAEGVDVKTAQSRLGHSDRNAQQGPPKWFPDLLSYQSGRRDLNPRPQRPEGESGGPEQTPTD